MRWVVARRAAAAAGVAAGAAILASFWRRALTTAGLPSPPAGPERAAEVTPAEREAAWAALTAQSMLERRIVDLDESRAEVGRLEERVAALETDIGARGEQLALARRLLAEHTAVANENLRLRGAVDALTDAITALHRSVGEGPTSTALEEEIEALRAELVGMELQVKELADERDRVVEEADRLRAALDAVPADRGADAERRLRAELDHVRTSLDVERQRNLRLGRRRLDHRD